MTIFILVLTGSYVMLMLALVVGWIKIPEFRTAKDPPATNFSIVVPYRNEAKNLPVLLRSLIALEYPRTKFEILLVNDASEDDSEKICLDFMKDHPKHQIFLINNFRVSDSPKKDAITVAIKNALFDHIITTDADCLVPKLWLQAFDQLLRKTDAKFIAGPVAPFKILVEEGQGKRHKTQRPADWETFRKKRRLKYFLAFQEMDILSLQLAGAGGFGLGNGFMCNGANLCYNRAAFYEVEGFSGNSDISSGDDVFLLQKFVEKKLKVAFLKTKEAIVLTKPQPDLTSLIAQRIRWAAKTPAYKSIFAKLTGLIVLLMNLFIAIGLILAFLQLSPMEPVIFAFLFKFIVDLLLLYKSAQFFGRKEVLRNYFWSSLLYPFFSTSAALMSLFKKVEWKGRVSRK